VSAVDGSAVADAVAGVCLVAGALLSLAAGVGLLRFPDLLSRMHAVTKPQVLGLLLILVGSGLRLRMGAALTTLLLVGVFQLVTAPVAAQIVGRAAYRSGEFQAGLLVVDELARAVPPRGEPASDLRHGAGRSTDGSGPDVPSPGSAAARPPGPDTEPSGPDAKPPGPDTAPPSGPGAGPG